MSMSKTFKDSWKVLSKAVDNTSERGEHYEETEKNTVHITYDKNGVPVNSYVDEDEGAEKAQKVKDSDYENAASTLLHNGKSKVEVVNHLMSNYGRSKQDATNHVNNATKKAMTNGETENPRENAEFGDDVQKPGESIHSKEWDDCVREVQAKQGETGGKVNAFAVCTAKLSDKAFKSEVRHLSYIKSEIKKAQKEVEKMGIEGAGSVPNSLLARQDLEGEADDEENRVQNDKNDVGQN